MPSIAQLLRAQGFDALLALDFSEVVATSGTFRAVVEATQPTDPEAILGEDNRERITLEFKRPGPSLARGERVTIDGAQWEMVRRMDDAGSPSVKFEAVKVV